MDMHNEQKDPLDDILGTISPIEYEKVRSRMMIAAKIEDAMKNKGWSKQTLMEKTGKKNPSIVTKWLSGTHNFTHDTLVEIATALDINLLNIEEKKKEPVTEFKILSISTNVSKINMKEIIESYSKTRKKKWKANDDKDMKFHSTKYIATA